MYSIKSDKGYVRFSTILGDYNENAYFIGFSEKPETFFTSEHSAKLNALLCELKNYTLVKKKISN
jgi:hypothetical protein